MFRFIHTTPYNFKWNNKWTISMSMEMKELSIVNKHREETKLSADVPCAPWRCLNEGDDARAPAPPDPKDQGFHLGQHGGKGATTTNPSRRGATLAAAAIVGLARGGKGFHLGTHAPPSTYVRPTTHLPHHRHSTPTTRDHAAHTTMAIDQHQVVSSAHGPTIPTI